MGRGGIAGLACALSVLGSAVAAEASNVFLDGYFGCGSSVRLKEPACDTGADWNGATLIAKQGERNVVTAARTGDTLTFEDSGATVSGPSRGQGSDFGTGVQCTPTGANVAACDVSKVNTGGSSLGFHTLVIDLKDEDDSLAVGEGFTDDGLNSGWVDLSGGAGNDTILLDPSVSGSYVFGDGGADRMTGGDGFDSIYGGKGRDRVTAGAGSDTLFLKDGERDVADCGSGRDSVRADRKDRLKGCEKVKR